MNAATEAASTNDRLGAVTGPREVTFVRVLPGPIERVWSFLADGDKRKLWLADGHFEPRLGGVAKLKFHNGAITPPGEAIPEDMQKFSGVMETQGRVTAWNPPHELGFSWWGEPGESSEVLFRLAPEADGRVKLTLIHRALKDRSLMLMIAGGWHAHLGLLVALAEDRAPTAFWGVMGGVQKSYEGLIPQE
ncbi:SRPBCC family protein [Methylopila sp. M107]|uniref:SRPBCC family protein n=1 Tax=Methylopila sp. M107 TaxID=1101190 RepID=UPI0003819D08|nr:SRPBCC family protein [Methylopila sp. M107]